MPSCAPKDSTLDFDLTITICSWNDRDDLRVCLQSLRELSSEVRFETIVVENNSGDDSGGMVAAEFPEVTLLRQSRNLGFTGGHNLAISQRRGRHWFCLNSDTVVHAGALRSLVDFLESNPDVGIVAPKLLNTDGSLQFSVRRFPNPLAAAFRNTLLGRLFPGVRAVKDYLMQDASHDQILDADWVSGAAFVMSEAALEKVGAFDPSYFMYCEDVDLCWRVHEAGLRVVYLPSAQVTHHIGRATDKAPNRMIGQFHRSMFQFYTRRQLPRAFVFSRPFLWALAAVGLSLRAGSFILKNRWDRWRRRG